MVKRLIIPIMALFIAGCGSGGSQSSTSTPTPAPSPAPTPTPAPAPANVQAGQWEFVLTPAPGPAPLPPGQPPPFYLEANLTVTGSNVFSTGRTAEGSLTVTNTDIFINLPLSDVNPPYITQPMTTCDQVALNATITGTMFAGTVNSFNAGAPAGTPPDPTLSSGTIAANAQSVSGGSYSATSSGVCSQAVATGSTGTTGPSGTFTAYAVTPVNGTYSGPLTLIGTCATFSVGCSSANSAAGQLTLVMTQTGLVVNGSGNLVLPQAEGTVTFTNSSTANGEPVENTAVGALLSTGGIANIIQGPGWWVVFAHLSQDGIHMTVFLQYQVSDEFIQYATGTLALQQ